MAKVTWLGEPGGPDETTFGGVTFPKGEAVDVNDERMVEKARANKYFRVDRQSTEGKVDPDAPVPNPMGRPEDRPENIAFASAEVLEARRETSETMQEREEEEARKRPGRPRRA